LLIPDSVHFRAVGFGSNIILTFQAKWRMLSYVFKNIFTSNLIGSFV